MSRKTRRNAFRNAATASRAAAKSCTYSKLGLSGFTLGSMAIGSTVFAAEPADGPAAAPKSSEPQELQEVVVTGIRASLQRAMDIKQQAVGVVDAVSAEDIGQFPDASIGEALARIPGVTVNRGSINGMASAGAPTATGNPSGITVRGFGTQFNEILTEGRPVASGNGQNFDFAALGAEYVGELDIHKTPDFSLSTGAVGATINIKSPRPFDHSGLQARAFGSMTDYQKDGGVRPAFGALFSDTFFDDTFGILVAGDYTDKHILGHHFDIVGWKGTYLNSCQMAGGPACVNDALGHPTTPANTFPSWYIQDQAMYLERTDSRRKDGRVAVQWRPTDAVLVTFDDNYSSDSEVTDRWQYSTWFGCFPAGCSNVTQDANGTITNFTNSNGPTDFNAFANRTYVTTNTPGLNVRWEPTDHWSGSLDVSQSTAHLNPNHTWTSLDVDTGYGPNTGLGTNGYTGGVAVSGDSKTLPYWTAYGPNTNALTGPATSANFLGQNPYIVGSHVLPIQEQINTDKINQAKIDATWQTEDTQVHFGVQFVQDTWDSRELDTFTNNEWQLWSGYGSASNNYVYYCGPNYTKPCADQHNPPPGSTQVLHGVPLPQSLFTPVSLGTFIPGFKGNGNLPPALNLYNPYAVLNYLITQPINADYKPNQGYAQYAGGSPTPVLSTGSVQHVDRKNYAPFVTGAHTFPIGDMSLKVNVGMRYQKTNVEIAGLSAPLTGLGLQPGDVTAYAFNLGSPTPITASNSYGYFLPSLDLNLLIRPNLKVRVDYSRTESPANNGQLIPNTTYGGRVNALSARGNNPGLLPYLSQNFDLGAEWYYGSNDYVAVDGFFKHVTQFPVSSVQNITVPGVIDTSPGSANFGNPAVFAETTVVNGLAANVHGIEATWQQMLWGGFGFQLNGTYVHSNSNFDPYSYTTNQFALPGIGNSANLIAFYQNYGFQARIAVQWQGEQLLQLGQEQNGGAFGNEPTYLQSNTELDFSSTYDINSHVSVFFEAINLTDNVYHTRGRFSNQTLNVVDYGRSFTIGVRAKL
jgi:TonB-dependent receptor